MRRVSTVRAGFFFVGALPFARLVRLSGEGGRAMDREELGRQAWAMRAALLRLAMSILKSPQDAEDAVSDAVVRAFERLATLRSDAAVRPWLMKITVRCCYERARRARRETLREDVEPLCPPVWPREEGSLMACIEKLPEGERAALILYYYEGFCVRDVARALGLPRPAASMRLSRGRRRLRELLSEEGRDEP